MTCKDFYNSLIVCNSEGSVGTLVHEVTNVTFPCNISIFFQEWHHVEMTQGLMGLISGNVMEDFYIFYKSEQLSLKNGSDYVFTDKCTFANAILVVFTRDCKTETLFTGAFP